MEIIYLNKECNNDLKDSCVALGFFDGMHLGHQKLVEKVIEVANKKNLKKALLTFDQHPKSYLANVSFKELMSLDDKAMFLEEYGFDYLFVLKFDFELASMRALDFINEFIVKTNIKHIICGFDFHFGKNGEGNFETLIQNEKNDYEVSVIKKQKYNHHKISSSYLKEALTNGDVELVEKLLGRYYCVGGKVVHGLKNGRKIGFPTVNIDANNYFLPKNGVYGVIIVIDGKRYLGMANLGYNPTFNVLTKISLEVNIFDFDQDVYGKNVTVFFIKKIRYEKRFDYVAEHPLGNSYKMDISRPRKLHDNTKAILHASCKYVNNSLNHIFQLSQEIFPKYLNKKIKQDDLKKINSIIAEIRWILAHSTPWMRGSDTISNVFIRAIYKALGIKSYPVKKNISLDLEAFCTELNDYKDNFTRYFTKPPKII